MFKIDLWDHLEHYPFSETLRFQTQGSISHIYYTLFLLPVNHPMFIKHEQQSSGEKWWLYNISHIPNVLLHSEITSEHQSTQEMYSFPEILHQ